MMLSAILSVAAILGFINKAADTPTTAIALLILFNLYIGLPQITFLVLFLSCLCLIVLRLDSAYGV